MTELDKLIQQRDELNQRIQELQTARIEHKDILLSRDLHCSEGWTLSIMRPLYRYQDLEGSYVEGARYVDVYRSSDKAAVIEHMLDLSIQLKEFADKLIVGE